MKNIIILLAFVISFKICKSQNILNKKDTINFLIDNEKIPINDQIITVEVGNNYVQYNINCPCLLQNSFPVFMHMYKTEEIKVKPAEFGLNKMIDIASLLKLVKNNYINSDINTKYAFYFFQRLHRKYLKRKVVFIQPAEIHDFVTIK